MARVNKGVGTAKWSTCAFTMFVLIFGAAAPGLGQLQLLSVTPHHGAVGINTSMTLAAVFNKPLDPSASFISTGTFLNCGLAPGEALSSPPNLTLSADGRALFLQAELAPETRFQYSLLGARAADGQMLDRPYTIAFATGPTLPSGSISGVVTYPEGSPYGTFVALYKQDLFAGQSLAEIARGGQRYVHAEHAACAAVVRASSGAYTVDYVPSGTWYPLAIKDLNGDGELSLFDDAWGFLDADMDLLPDSILLAEGERRGGVDLTVSRLLVPLTARGAITAQSPLADAWSADAEPFYLRGRDPDSLGRCWQWMAQFYSAMRDADCSLVCVGTLVGYTAGPRHGELVAAWPPGWQDSPAVFDSALAHGGDLFLRRTQVDSVIMELGWSSRHLPLPYGQGQLLWNQPLELLWRVAFFGPGGEFYAVALEPLSGGHLSTFSRLTLTAKEAHVSAGQAATVSLGGPTAPCYAGADVQEDGTAWRWLFRFCPTGQTLDVAVSPYGVQPDSCALPDLTAAPLPEGWVDSDLAVAAALAAGGRQFLDDHRGARLAAELLWLDPAMPLIPATQFTPQVLWAPPEELLDRWGIHPSPARLPVAESSLSWRVSFAAEENDHFLLALVDPLSGTVTDRYTHSPSTARHNLSLVEARARKWGPRTALIAVLAWGEDVDTAGTCAAWGYLYARPQTDSSMILVGADSMIVEAHYAPALPTKEPLPLGWLDSPDAVALAEEHGGRAFRVTHRRASCAATLARGWIEAYPHQPVWVVSYRTPEPGPALEVAIDALSGQILTAVRGQSTAEPSQPFSLGPVFPNPCNAGASIFFALPKPERVIISVYGVTGRLVWRTALPPLPAGHHSVQWSGCDDQGRPVPSGIYIVRVRAGVEEACAKVGLCR